MILSVVIPCYNHGEFVQDAIDSVLTYQDQSIEIIIVDDGSTDLATINKIDELKKAGYHIIQHKNSGLAFSRNAGILAARGKYILPLDADNKIKSDYIRKGIKLLDQGICDIVYAKPSFFGENIPERKFLPYEFLGHRLFSSNYIDACAIFRKSVWKKIGGYDEKMPYQGHEDWEFWLKCYVNEFRFVFINEELYEYRIDKGSMITQISSQKFEANQDYIMIKYKNQIFNHIERTHCFQQFYENDQKNYLRTSFKYLSKFFRALLE
ncbi:glycosyltransferase family 2 protein [Pedobacter kyonggii]|uniref:Glycosyltransferase n=1 Tax=Pedobacter kyonggii TaxID=1926871 RepID=A0A4Q9HCT0_9SPHI|nr:glycosyltransferase [Pedobacter kyonggii]TBO42183.1 glycosyltransferase [Pedobacter kyonggii]